MKCFGYELLSALVVFLYSCESFEWFRSEGGIKKDFEGVWIREFLADTTVHEIWTIKDDKINIIKYDLATYVPCSSLDTPSYKCQDNGINDVIQNDSKDTLLLDNGNYSIDAKITNSYIKTSDFSMAEYAGNLKWTIVQLDENVLYLVAESEVGLLQREFEREK
jgi:hypothetical protein